MHRIWGASHLVTEGLAVIAVQVSAGQLPVMLWVQLLESVQRHDCLLPDQVLGVAGKPRHSWQHSVDQVRAYQLADGCQGCAHCSGKQRVIQRRSWVCMCCAKVGQGTSLLSSTCLNELAGHLLRATCRLQGLLTNQVIVAFEVLCQCVDDQDDQVALIVQKKTRRQVSNLQPYCHLLDQTMMRSVYNNAVPPLSPMQQGNQWQ